MTWIEQIEASGQQELPACPFCRQQMMSQDMLAILGRSFQPRAGSSSAAELDELSMFWLQQFTRSCRGCGSRIEKIEGCDLMECLCGYRFCYRCQSQGAQCSCPDSDPIQDHVFWDNILQDAPPLEAREAPIDDETGHLDLRRHIIQTKQRLAIDEYIKGFILIAIVQIIIWLPDNG